MSALAATLAGCATPPLRLSPVFAVGDVRTYRLTARAHTVVDLPGTRQSETTELTATSTIEVTAVNGDEATVRLTLTPLRLARAGTPVAPPPEQRAEVVVGPDGSLIRVVTVGGLPPSISGADVGDLTQLLSSPLPAHRVRLGDRWNSVTHPAEGATEEPAHQQGRISGLRSVGGRDCVLIDLGTRRPLVRRRSIGGQPVQLAGTEFAQSRIAFSLRDGFAVEMTTEAEARFSVSTAAAAGGSVTIDTRSSLLLISAKSGGQSAG